MGLNSQEPCAFKVVPTPVVTERAGVLYVPEKYFKESTVVTRGTTLAAFLPGVDKADALNRGYGAYTLTEPTEAPDGYLGFYFNKPKTSEQKATAIRNPVYEREPSSYWPPVVNSIVALEKSDGTWTFELSMKESYDGPVWTKTEEFFSPDEFDITQPTGMRPLSFDGRLRVGGLPYDSDYGRLQLPRCLRSAASFVVTIPSFTIGAINYTSASMYVEATPNYTDWPATLITYDKQRQVSGGWLRRTVTEYKPL